MKIYLAIPYSGIEEKSFYIANKLSAILMKKGYIVFSPISHSHPIAIQESLPGTWEFWEKFDKSFIEWADRVYVVEIGKEGIDLIERSKGVQAEIKIANELKKPVDYYKFDDI